jgi:hypothetical protein
MKKGGATFNFIELLVWGKKNKTYRHLVNGKRKQPKLRLVLNERAWLRLSGKLFEELPRDEAISVLNAIKQCAK